jgi:hypothetical protein
MANIKKLVIYSSEAELNQHAANYPCLVNYHVPTKSGVIDDGCGHYADVTFTSVNSKSDLDKLPTGPFENIVLVGFEVPTVLTASEE